MVPEDYVEEYFSEMYFPEFPFFSKIEKLNMIYDPNSLLREKILIITLKKESDYIYTQVLFSLKGKLLKEKTKYYIFVDPKRRTDLYANERYRKLL